MPTSPISSIEDPIAPIASIDSISLPVETFGTTDTYTCTWNDDANAWCSSNILLQGDCYLRVTLPERGRLAIRKSNDEDGPWPVVLMSPWTGPDFEIRIYGETKGKYIRVETTARPTQFDITPI